MNILVRCLSDDSIENTIFCLNYKFDKVIFCDTQHHIDFNHKHIESFLKSFCKLSDIEYFYTNKCDIDDIVNYLNNYVNNNDKLFVDLTGAESFCSVAYTKFALENNIPLYYFNIRKNEIKIINNDCKYTVDVLKHEQLLLSVNDYITMAGGKIISFKDESAIISKEDTLKIINIRKEFCDIWSYYSSLLQSSYENNQVIVYNLNIYFSKYTDNKITKDEIEIINSKLLSAGLIYDYYYSEDHNSFKFKYKNDYIKTLFDKTGNVYELDIYMQTKGDKDNDKCIFDVTLDWDGKIQRNSSDDVINEVDVLTIDNYILTFISCKDCHDLQNDAINELHSVATRFGGKYVNKIIACSCECNKGEIDRALENSIFIKHL